jgi:uncharacterized protein (TIGR03086 family)
MATAADEYRTIAGVFTDRVHGVAPGAWENPAPCDGWVARDVVRHLLEWFPVDEDPVSAWVIHSDGVQALLDDPATQGRVLSNRHVGNMPLDQAVGQFYTNDVFLHTWDLARATGQDERLDRDKCAQLLDGMLPMDQALRASGHYGPRVELAEDADAQTRLIAFIGRKP